MIDTIIGLIEEISSTNIINVGFLTILFLMFIAVLVCDSFLLSAIMKTRQVIDRFEKAGKSEKPSYNQLSNTIAKNGIGELRQCWHKNICRLPDDSKSYGWQEADSVSLSQETLSLIKFRSTARFVPGLLVLLSVVFAIIAVVAGLEKTSSDTNISISAELWKQSVLMIILGILASLAFVAFDRLFEFILVKLFARIYQETSRILINVREDDWKRVQILAVNKSARLIENMSESMTNSIISVAKNDLLPGLEDSYKKSLDKYLQPEISRLREASTDIAAKVLQLQQTGMAELADSFYNKLSTNTDVQLERQSSTIEKLNYMQQVGAERLELIMSRSNDNLSMQRELNEHALQTIEGITASQSSLAEAAERLASGMRSAGELADGMQALLQADRELLSVLATDREEMQRLNDGYYEKMNNQILQLQDDLNSEITSLLSRFTDIYTVTFENIEEQTGGLIENFDNQTRSLMESLDSQVRDLTFLTKDVTAEIADLNKNLKESTLEYSNGIESSLNGHLSSLDTNVNELMSKLVSTTELIRESVDDLPAAVLLARMSIEGGSDQSNSVK